MVLCCTDKLTGARYVGVSVSDFHMVSFDR